MINLIKQVKTKKGYVDHYAVDNAADRDSIENPVVGTTALVIDEGLTYAVDSNGAWYQVATGGSGGGGGGEGGGGLDPSKYYTRQQVDAKIGVETTRATEKENQIDAKFSDYSKTTEIHKIKVDEAIKADSATKATQDGNGKVIADTYATKENTYTKEEIDGKVSAVFRYKGSVPTIDKLPKGAEIGDVYDVLEDGMNYAWNGSAWDPLGASVDLTNYLRKDDAAKTYATQDALNNVDAKFNNYATKASVVPEAEIDNKIKTETDRAKGVEAALDSRLKTVEESGGGGGTLPPENYYTKQEVDNKIKTEVPNIKVNNADKADKDSKGNIITDTYAAKANVYNKDEVDAKVSSVYKYKGSVETYADLPTVDRHIGDVYDVQDTGNNYAWDGAKWDSLGMKINLTEYLKKDDAAAVYATQAALTAEINRSTAKDNEIDGRFNDYALKEDTISSAEVDNKIKAEENRASMREDAIDNKFADYTKTSNIHSIRVDNATNAINSVNATKAETAIKATQDSNGHIISDTYMKKTDTYTKSEIDDKVSAVYKYKGSVSTYANLPKTGNKVGDVWDVRDTGTNYAWNGAEWDSLGTGIDLSAYLKVEDAKKNYATKGELVTEKNRAINREDELNTKFNEYTPTNLLQYASVNKANEAIKATQDGKGNVIDVTYAKNADLIDEVDRATIRENAIDSKFSNYQLISNAVTISDIKAEVNEEETRATNQETVLNTAITTEVGRASAKEAEIEAKFKDYRTAADQSKIDNNLSAAITAEMNRAKEAEKVLDEKIAAGGGSGGGGLPTDSYYTKTEIDNKLRDEVPNIKVNEAIKATQDGKGNVIDTTYATKAEIVSESKVDEKINTEKTRAESRENAIESKFVDYATIESLATATVEKAGTADSATKATQDGNGLVIADTYATKENTYTKEEVDGKVTSVYKYKNSVKTYADLPKENNVVGDVYDVQEDGMNYAWNGVEWDKLGGTVDLSAYMRTDDANKSFATKGELSTTDSKFANYTTTEGLAEASVKHATTATQDAAGNVITTTYAKDSDVIKSDEIDRRIKVETDRATGVETGFDDRISALEAGGGGGGDLPSDQYYTKTQIDNKLKDYTTTEGLANAKVAEATKATQDANGKVIADTYATQDALGIVDAKFTEYVKTTDLPTASVKKSEEATKATQDAAGNVITETYATIANTYDKDTIDTKLTAIYKFKGNVANFEALPKEGQTKGDVYNTLDTGDNYAWDGAAWDKLGGTVDLSEYQKTADADLKYVTPTSLSTTLEPYAKIESLKTASVNKANEATKATQDAKGNVIDTTYAKDVDVTKSDEIDRRIKVETDRAKGVETGFEDRISVLEAGGGSGGGGDLPTDKFYTKTQIDNKFKDYTTTEELANASVNKANEATKATQDSNGKVITVTYATKDELGTVEGKFADYTTTAGLASATVGKANEATKATQDAAGNVIADTYATKENTYTKDEVDNKVSSVYKYKGSVTTYSNLPAKNQVVGDVYNVEDTGANYAWDGKSWDQLGMNVDLGPYQKTEDADAKYATQDSLKTVDNKFALYTKTDSIKTIKVNNAIDADNALKASQDAEGNVITTHYAPKSSVTSSEEIDSRITAEKTRAEGAEGGLSKRIKTLEDTPLPQMDLYYTSEQVDTKLGDYATTASLANATVKKAGEATKATQDAKGNVIENTYATKNALSTVDGKFVDYATTESLKTATVGKAGEATKATQDSNGNAIIDTYATKADTYTKEEVDNKVSSVYKYKGSVPNYDSLPKDGQTKGDVYNVEDTGDNYAWDGAAWDKLGGTVNLEEYLKKAEAEKTYATPGSVDTKLADYVKTTDLTTASVKKADEATKATQDGNGAVIADTYATQTALGETDAKFANYATTESLSAYVTTDSLPSTLAPYAKTESLSAYAKTESLSAYATTESLKEATVKKAGTADEATKATQDAAGNVITTTYAKDADLKKEAERAVGIENGLADRISAIEAGGGGSGPAPDLKDYLKKTEAATTYATISSVETIDGKFKDYATTASLANASVNKANEAIKATQDGKGNVIDTTYATQDALSVVDGKFADYATTESLTSTLAPYAKTESLSAYATTESLKTATVQKAGTADEATKATQDGDGNVISATYVKTNDLTTASVKKAESADSATKATQDGNGAVIADTYATIANTYDKETIDTKLTAVYKFKGSVANYDALPKEGQTAGDVYDTLDTGTNYAWTGTSWDSLGGSSVDLSAYLKTEDAAKTYATQDALSNVDAKFAGYTPSTDIHSIIVDTATKAMQDGNGAIITDTYVSNETLTTKLGDYATTASLADATVKKSGETDSITNATADQGPWKVNMNPKAATNNPGNVLWFDTKSKQIRNANTGSLKVNHALKASQDDKGNVIDTFYAKGADLTALDERVTAIEAGGGGGTGPDLKEYLKKTEAATTYATIETVNGIDDRVKALETGGGGGGTAPDLKDYYKKSETYSQKQVNDAIKVETDRATGIENGLEKRVKALEDAPSGGGGGTSGGGGNTYPSKTGNLDLNNPPADKFFMDEATYNKANNSPKSKWTVNGTVGAFFDQLTCGDIKLQVIKLVVNTDTSANFQRSKPSKNGNWSSWGKSGYNPW